MDVNFFLQLVINGLVVGSVYALVALGFVIIFKSTSVVNFAQGEFLLLGAYISLAVVGQYNMPFWVAVIITLLFSVVLGMLIERLILRPMIGEPVISVIMVTPIQIGPLPVSQGYIYSVVCVAILLLLFTLFFKYSRAGVAMRATAFSQQVAQSMGISVRRMFALAWAIAAVVSAIGGILLGGVRGGVDAALAAIGLKVIPVVILGGLDSIIGAIVGGLIVGVLENLAGGYLDPIFGGGVKEVAPFVILVLILMIKPYGLFGKVHIDRV